VALLYCHGRRQSLSSEYKWMVWALYFWERVRGSCSSEGEIGAKHTPVLDARLQEFFRDDLTSCYEVQTSLGVWEPVSATVCYWSRDHGHRRCFGAAWSWEACPSHTDSAVPWSHMSDKVCFKPPFKWRSFATHLRLTIVPMKAHGTEPAQSVVTGDWRHPAVFGVTRRLQTR